MFTPTWKTPTVSYTKLHHHPAAPPTTMSHNHAHHSQFLPFQRLATLALSMGMLGAIASAQFAPDRVVVELRANVAELPEFVDFKLAFAGDPALQTALAESGAHSMYRVFRSGGVAPANDALFHSLGMHRHYVIELGENSNLDQVQRALAASASVAAVRLDGIVHATETPNDPLFVNQWDHRNAIDADMDTDLAWDFAKSDPSIVVAVIDTGCDVTHPDIAAAMVPGYNFVANNNNPADDNGHGTACAGIIGARSNNSLDIAGVAPNCRIMPIKSLNGGGSGTYSAVAAGINFAANNGASIISMSLGGGCCDSGVDAALAYATGLDVLCIAATGNSNVNGIIYPASHATCMAIGASSPCDERKSLTSCDGETWWGSNYGTDIDVVAPGVLIPTHTIGGGTTLSFNGTSAATPHVAGIAALVRSIDPTLSETAVRNLIRATAEDQVGPISEDTLGFDIYFGFGRANAHRAALAAMGANTFCSADGSGTPPPCGNGGGADVGARNSTGSGALLNASGTNSIGLDDLVLVTTSLPANKPSLTLMAPAMNNGGMGTPFFDGLLCVAAGGVGVFRHPPQVSSAGGTLAFGPGIAAYSCSHFSGQACILPGSHWNFQVWYRDATGPCSTGANLTNGLGVTFRP